MSNLPDPKAIKEYQQHMDAWQEALGLTEWRAVLAAKKAPAAMADVVVDLPARMATFRLGDFKGATIDSSTLEACAVHEWLHVLLAPLIAFAKAPQTPDEHLDFVEHGIIRALERLLLPPETKEF